MITSWRIFPAAFAEHAFTGEGAMRIGGRWHSPGTRVVYTAQSIALATLEILVHGPEQWMIPDFALAPCTFAEKLVEVVDVRALPEDWQERSSPPELQQFGNAWAREQRSAVLKVPSAVIPLEFNYLLNPEHPDFASIEIGDPRPFSLDPRLRM